MPKERWIVIPDTHEAIISKEDVAAVQEKMKNRRKSMHRSDGAS